MPTQVIVAFAVIAGVAGVTTTVARHPVAGWLFALGLAPLFFYVVSGGRVDYTPEEGSAIMFYLIAGGVCAVGVFVASMILRAVLEHYGHELKTTPMAAWVGLSVCLFIYFAPVFSHRTWGDPPYIAVFADFGLYGERGFDWAHGAALASTVAAVLLAFKNRICVAIAAVIVAAFWGMNFLEALGMARTDPNLTLQTAWVIPAIGVLIMVINITANPLAIHGPAPKGRRDRLRRRSRTPDSPPANESARASVGTEGDESHVSNGDTDEASTATATDPIAQRFAEREASAADALAHFEDFPDDHDAPEDQTPIDLEEEQADANQQSDDGTKDAKLN